MRLRHFVLCAVLLAIAVARQSALAWMDDGHMAVAYVAYQHLTPAIRDRANALLKKNTIYYPKWLAKVPAGTSSDDRDMMIFMMAATWPDEIKASGSGYTIDPGSTNGDRPGPDLTIAAQNIGYSDMLLHKYWHFVDTPFSDDGTALPALPIPDAETQIVLFRAALSSDKSDDVKSYDLAWLLHLVGDVHQPLHCSTRVSSIDPQGDLGGNKVAICATAGKCGNELHAYWDGLPGTDRNIETAIKYASGLPLAPKTLATKLDTAVWIAEGVRYAKRDVYVDPIKAGDGPFTLTAAYKQSAHRVARGRVALAGTRLANVLNGELK